MFEEIYKLPTSVALDLVGMMLGKKLGEGQFREVYELAIDPSKVIKLECGAGDFQNAMEWELWDEVRWTQHARWFAPCHAISACGSVLLMERTTPLVKPPPKTTRIPAYLADTKLENFGRIGNRIVCHDYARNLLVSHGLTSRMRKPKWW